MKGGKTLIMDTLYFGFSRNTSAVTKSEWDCFLWDVVTPRFPGGFTYWKANGQWKDIVGLVYKESSMVLQVIHGSSANNAIQEIIDLYKEKYCQESVLRVQSKVIARF